MIVCEPKYLEDRCRERGYTLEEVMPCVTKQEGGLWWIDETHASYPHPKNPEPQCLAGTELKSLLGWLGLGPSSGCQCADRAAAMDREGCQWVKDNVEEIVSWLAEEARNRGLPFFRTAGRYLVLRAVRLAEAKAQSTVSV